MLLADRKYHSCRYMSRGYPHNLIQELDVVCFRSHVRVQADVVLGSMGRRTGAVMNQGRVRWHHGMHPPRHCPETRVVSVAIKRFNQQLVREPQNCQDKLTCSVMVLCVLIDPSVVSTIHLQHSSVV
jgi:hypothetical protein